MLRDARHVALPQLGHRGQQSIAAGTVLLIGAGGIGCAAATYLATSGVGNIVVVDFDSVDETNLGRQILFTPRDVGRLKAEVAAKRLMAMNPTINVTPVAKRLDDDELDSAVAAADVVLDGCDNFSTRFQVNAACVNNATTHVSGAAIRMEGQLAVFGPDYSLSPCYRCLYAEDDESLDNCAGNGVLAPVPGVIGTMMAVEALKSLASIDHQLAKLSLYDAMTGQFTSVGIRKLQSCPVCCSA
jgi:adenylyltransferase/sulfurtransferase